VRQIGEPLGTGSNPQLVEQHLLTMTQLIAPPNRLQLPPRHVIGTAGIRQPDNPQMPPRGQVEHRRRHLLIRHVIEAVERMTGLQVTEVNVTVHDVYLDDGSNDDDNDAPARVQ